MAQENRDLVLPPGEYCYMQDNTKGVIKVYVGPCVVNQTGQDIPIVYDPQGDKFRPCADLASAVKKRPVAVQRDYLVLFNPTQDGGHPDRGVAGKPAPELNFGRKVNIPGPCEFALWPGQAAVRIQGHHLRSNQYLLVKIYDADEARKNWSSAVVETKTGEARTDDLKGKEVETVAIGSVPEDLAVGKLYLVKGTEVSFYIPPTGVSVVQNESGEFVRDALTLERLEYAILVDEDGNKEYPRGPAVVFPKPTQQFIFDKRGSNKFRAIELNELQGIHAKVIATYKDNKGVLHDVGEELFIRGDEEPIYYPREEHSLISYDGKSKHYATAIPAGEARYVLDRLTGEIKTVTGPAMLLPDPRSEVIVRRVLTENQCKLWYPGNDVVYEYNNHLRDLVSKAPTTRAGAVSEGDFERGSRGKRSAAKFMNLSSNAIAERSLTSAVNAEESHFVADEFSRASTYTEPRTVTLNTKLEGVPTINIWTGYAVQVVDKQGERRVVQGPDTVLLGYDEELEAMALSTGKPKTTDTLYYTPYLRVKNNKVSDIVDVETADHVGINIKLSFLVDFTGEPSLWFGVENYVKVLTDHVRSVLKGAVQKMGVAEFYATSVDVIRTLILGAKGEDGNRFGMHFVENGMQVRDVDVLKVRIQDDKIHQLLSESQHNAVATNIQLETARREFNAAKEREELQRAHISIGLETAMEKLKAESLLQQEQACNRISKVQADQDVAKAQKETTVAMESIEDAKHKAGLARRAEEETQAHKFQEMALEQRIRAIEVETKSVVDRFGAAQAGFSEALIAMSRDETAVKVAEASSIQRFIGGDNFSSALATIFNGAGPLIERVTGNGAKNNKASYAKTKGDQPQG